LERAQINVRLPELVAERLDAKRIELKKSLGKIPSRSEVVRLALDEYLKKKA
jgi:Arc/MetJ-type ribon-helix-helix transcriptional regulator